MEIVPRRILAGVNPNQGRLANVIVENTVLAGEVTPWDARLCGDGSLVGGPLIFIVFIGGEGGVIDAGRVFLTPHAVEIPLKSYHAATSLLAEAEPGLLWPAGVHTLCTLVWTRFDLLANWGDLFSLIVIIGNYTIVK